MGDILRCSAPQRQLQIAWLQAMSGLDGADMVEREEFTGPDNADHEPRTTEDTIDLFRIGQGIAKMKALHRRKPHMQGLLVSGRGLLA